MPESVSYKQVDVSPDYSLPPEVGPILEHFDGILEIPRPSKKEEEIRKYLMRLAEARGFETKTDSVGNLSIDVPASPGCEDKPRIILQGHMDMVPYGGNDKNPTEAEVDAEGWMTAKGGTTLGADNGIALAMAFALVDDKTIEHGPLTILITVDEETGLTGANGLDPNIIPEDAAILVNMDSEEGDQFITKGSAGGVDVVGSFDISEKAEVPENYQELEFRLTGLRGGHSGDEIHEERGNAIRMLNRILLLIKSEIDPDFKLIEYSGGTVRNSIPRDAKVKIAVPSSLTLETIELLKQTVRAMRESPNESLNLSVQNAKNMRLQVIIDIVRSEALQAISDEVRDGILESIEKLPDGPIEATGGFKGGVMVSSNLGLLDKPRDDDGEVTDENVLQMGYLVRAADTEKMHEQADEIAENLRAVVVGAVEAEKSGEYQGWLEEEDAPAIRLAVEAARESLGGVEPKVFAYHAGLESSVLKQRIVESGKHRTDISAVSVGPVIKNPHGPEEKTQLDSVARTYRMIRLMLEKVA